MTIAVQFFGAAGEVTGSCHLVSVADARFLLDCGQIQGGREEEARNAEAFPFEPAEIDAVVLSHAHIDHCGRLPLLAARGFGGRVHCTPATAQLLQIMLEDAYRLMLSDVEQQNRQRQRRGQEPLEPLYLLADVEQVLAQLSAHPYGEEFEPVGGARCRFSDAGHIIGAAIVECWLDNGEVQRKLVFSGDIGPQGTPYIHDPTPIEEADLVLLESTYGDRLHRERLATVAEIGQILERAWQAGGNVLIPAFAVGRSQEILYWCAQNYEAWGLQRFRIFLDSPMAAKVVGVYQDNKDLFDPEAQALLARRNPFELPNLSLVERADDSRALNRIDGGAIIIAGSGMCNGGRIRHHLKHNLWKRQTQVVIPGFQARGTLGRELVEGRRSVRIFGEEIRVMAAIHTVGGLSAHADQAGLLAWYGAFRGTPPVILVHGEDPAREVLAGKLRQQHGAKVKLARPGLYHALAR